ncbi:esterase/lipase family protein [Ralstonia nicotianae]
MLLLLLAALPVFGASNYIRKGPHNESLIVFVHGVTGDATATWTNSKTGAFWPQLMAEDSLFSSEDIFVYGYPSPKAGSSYNINELAEDMRLTLAAPLTSHKRVIFLVHSMGGLVVRQFLLKYRDVADQVGFIYFYATPTTGSPMATLAALFSRNPQLGDLKPMRSDEYLANLQRDWLASGVLRAIPAFCAYEMRPLLTTRVVEQESASNLCNQPLDPIDANHIDIVKPDSTLDKPYLTFAAAYISLMGKEKEVGLRAEVQNIRQLIGIRGAQPTTQGKEPIFCDSMKLSLVLASSARGKSPILINSIRVNSAPLEGAQLPAGAQCKVDRFSSQPHGIIERNTYLIQVDEASVRGKFLKDAVNSVPVDSQNVLIAGAVARAISLRPGEEPVGLDFYLQSTSKQPQQITFTIDYDEGGERKLTTDRVILWK